MASFEKGYTYLELSNFYRVGMETINTGVSKLKGILQMSGIENLEIFKNLGEKRKDDIVEINGVKYVKMPTDEFKKMFHVFGISNIIIEEQKEVSESSLVNALNNVITIFTRDYEIDTYMAILMIERAYPMIKNAFEFSPENIIEISNEELAKKVYDYIKANYTETKKDGLPVLKRKN